MGPQDAIDSLDRALAAWGGQHKGEVYEAAAHEWTMPDAASYNEARAERAFVKLTALFANALSRQASGERMLRDQRGFNDAAADEMFLDDPLEDRRIALPVPRTFWIHDGDRSAFADAQAVHFRAQNPALL